MSLDLVLSDDNGSVLFVDKANRLRMLLGDEKGYAVLNLDGLFTTQKNNQIFMWLWPVVIVFFISGLLTTIILQLSS